MKPLVYYCRWQQATLRLRGRDATAVWGELVFNKNGVETAQTFRFDLDTNQITLEGEDGPKQIQLDEMGVEIKP